MKRPTIQTSISLTALSAMVILFSGCSMCCGPYDYHYPTYGGKHQRVDPAYGRVGSIFSDPIAGYNGPNADSNLESHPEFEPRDPVDEDDGMGMDDDGERTTQGFPRLKRFN